MSDKKVMDGQDQAVLAQAFPQLETPSNNVAQQPRPDPASHLQVVPAPGEAASNQPAPVPAPQGGVTPALAMFADVPVMLTFEVGRQPITVQQLMMLARGSVLPLQNVLVDLIEVKVSDITVARAEAISLKKKVGIRINEIIVPANLDKK